jgi:hypothetical protein
MMRDERPLYQILEELEESNWTTRALGVLDYVVPGEWENVTRFERMIELVTGESDQGVIQSVGEKAIEIYSDPSNGYQRAVWVFQTVDSVDKLAGAATFANKIGEKWDVFGLLEKVTPKADTTQSIDAALKFAAELTTFCLINGIPGDSIGDFASSLVNAAKEDVMRIAAFLTFDCVIPLGPDFLSKVMGMMHSISEGELSNNSLFKALRSYLPGSSVVEQRQLILTNVEANAGFLAGFVQNHGIEQKSMIQRLREYVDIADDKLDYLAATLDVMTDYYTHTGVQTVARRVAQRAYQEL